MSTESANRIREHQVATMADTYDLKRHDARLLLDLVAALSEYQLNAVAVDPAVAAKGQRACADPWFAYALAEEAMRSRSLVDAVEKICATPPRGASRAVRGGLQYLNGRVRELRGEPIAAITAYRKSAELHESPFTRDRQAMLEFYRGNYAAARTMLDQAGSRPVHATRDALARVIRHTLPAEPNRKLGRNEPCWCDSGRKYKVCHGRSGASIPLRHRAPGLYDRAATFVIDAAPDPVMELLTLAHMMARGPVPEESLMPLILDLLLIEGHLMIEFSDRYAAILPDDEVELLRQWHQQANRSVFDVEAVVPGESMTLRDMRTGGRYEVMERGGSQQVRPGWYLCTRVADVAGELHLFGGFEPVPSDQRGALMALLDTSPTPHDITARLADRFGPPMILSLEGDPLEISETHYEVADPEALRPMLAELFEPVGDGAATDGTGHDEWVWLETVDADQRRSLAALRLAGDELVITTTTAARLERVLELLWDAGADLDELDAARSMPGALQYSEWDDDIPTCEDLSMEEIQANRHLAEVFAAMTAQLEEHWLDKSMPALAGVTPRQAAADPTRRDDLIRLLDSLPSSGAPLQMDAERLRAALGL